MTTQDAKPTQPAKLLIPAKEAAATLSISSRLLWSLTNSGQIPVVRLRRRTLYSPADLQNWLEKQTTGGN